MNIPIICNNNSNDINNYQNDSQTKQNCGTFGGSSVILQGMAQQFGIQDQDRNGNQLQKNGDAKSGDKNHFVLAPSFPAVRSNHLLELVDISHHQGHIDQATNVVSSTGRRNQFMDWKITNRRRERIGNRFVLCHFRWSTENKHLKT